jgi:hypothetical protein
MTEQVLGGLSMLRPVAEQVTAIPIPTREEMLADIAEARAAYPRFFLDADET